MPQDSSQSEQRHAPGAIQPVKDPPEAVRVEPAMGPQVPQPFSAWQLAGALLIAGASDVVGGLVDATIAGVPATIPLDMLTALALWAMLGRPVILLVALIAEALPGVGMLPLWSAVVIAIAMTGGIPGRMPR
jgi:hypothetical protein